MKQILLAKLSSRKFVIGLIVTVIGFVVCALGDVQYGMPLICLGAGGYMGCEALLDMASIIFGSKAMAQTTESED